MSHLVNKILASFQANTSRQAFCFEDKYYSYFDLNRKVFGIVEQVRYDGFDELAGKNIGVVANDDFETYASLIACWIMGVAYVPVNPSFPKERNRVIIQEAGIEYLLSSSKISDEITSEFGSRKIINTSDLRDFEFREQNQKNVNEENIAYILFTSGSTGVPKGVSISHLNLSSFIDNFNSTGYQIESSDRCLQMFELTFDVSVSSFLLPLLKGACIYPVGNKGIKYMQVLKCIQDYKLTNIQIVPSIIRLAGPMLKRFKFPEVKNCIVTGEATSIELIPALKECMVNTTIFNFYGPTEATIYCSFYKCNNAKVKSYHGMLSIGKAMGELELIVIDEASKEAETNIKGELYIGGNQLSIGYLNNASQTAESFLELDAKKGKIYYKSGDMAYKDEDGDIYYCGRFDNQVKIQGHRIELGEIEFMVRDGFGINSIVSVGQNKVGESELVLVLEFVHANISEKILAYLKGRLPTYMIPGKISLLEQFPLTSSGKTDRRKIREEVVR